MDVWLKGFRNNTFFHLAFVFFPQKNGGPNRSLEFYRNVKITFDLIYEYILAFGALSFCPTFMMQYSEPWCKSLVRFLFIEILVGGCMDSVLVHTHTHEEDYADLNFNRKNPRLQVLRSKSGFRMFPHPRASWYNRRLTSKSRNRNMFIFEGTFAAG